MIDKSVHCSSIIIEMSRHQVAVVLYLPSFVTRRSCYNHWAYTCILIYKKGIIVYMCLSWPFIEARLEKIFIFETTIHECYFKPNKFIIRYYNTNTWKHFYHWFVSNQTQRTQDDKIMKWQPFTTWIKCFIFGPVNVIFISIHTIRVASPLWISS